jgi:hypothetical protein
MIAANNTGTPIGVLLKERGDSRIGNRPKISQAGNRIAESFIVKTEYRSEFEDPDCPYTSEAKGVDRIPPAA